MMKPPIANATLAFATAQSGHLPRSIITLSVAKELPRQDVALRVAGVTLLIRPLVSRLTHRRQTSDNRTPKIHQWPISTQISAIDDEWRLYEQYRMDSWSCGHRAGSAVGPRLALGARLEALQRLPAVRLSPQAMATCQTSASVEQRGSPTASRGVAQRRPDGGAR